MNIRKYIASVLLVALAGGLPLAAQAQTDLKVGVVDVQRVFANAPQAAEAQKALEQEFNKRQEEIKQLQQEMLSLREQLSREGVTMTEEERNKLQEQLLSKDRKFRWEQQIYDEDLKIRRQEVLGKIQDEVVKTIYQIGQNEKYDLILNEGVIYSHSRVNLTERVIETLKEKADQ